MEKVIVTLNKQNKIPGIIIFYGKENMLGEECLVFAQNMLFKCLIYQDICEAIEVISDWAIIPDFSENLIEIKFKFV